jgi:hypothetical protein
LKEKTKMTTIEGQKALDKMKVFLAVNGGLDWAELVATIAGLSVEGADAAIKKHADELYGALLKTQPKLAFGMTVAFVSMVHDQLLKGSRVYVEGQLQTRKWTDQSAPINSRRRSCCKSSKAS